MKKIFLFFIIHLMTVNLWASDFKRHCEGLSEKDCLHSQGLYTDQELENVDINQEEISIAKNRREQSTSNAFTLSKVESD